MDFREEYKKAAQSLNPDEQSLERMRENVCRELRAPGKKPIPLKRAAVIMGGIAACAIVAFGISRLLPRGGITYDNAFSSACGSAAEKEELTTGGCEYQQEDYGLPGGAAANGSSFSYNNNILCEGDYDCDDQPCNITDDSASNGVSEDLSADGSAGAAMAGGSFSDGDERDDGDWEPALPDMPEDISDAKPQDFPEEYSKPEVGTAAGSDNSSSGFGTDILYFNEDMSGCGFNGVEYLLTNEYDLCDNDDMFTVSDNSGRRYSVSENALAEGVLVIVDADGNQVGVYKSVPSSAD